MMNKKQGFEVLRYCILTCVFSIAYYVFGRAALLLSLPPGYASVVWPSAGIALGILLIFGKRYWPSILLGSTFTHLFISFDGSTTATILKSIMLASSIGCGAVAQALFGVYLSRFVTHPITLSSTRAIIKFTILTAVISTLCNATISNFILWTLNIITLYEIPQNWLMWWTGDVMGVFVFTPLMFVFFGEPRKIWRPRVFKITLVSLITACLYVTFFYYYLNLELHRTRYDFRDKTNYIAVALQVKLDNAVRTLIVLQGYFNASKLVTRQEFRQFAGNLLKEHAEIQALSWNPIILHAQLEQYIQLAKQDGYSQFKVTQLKNGVRVADQKRDYYYVVFFLEPYIGNESVLGFNLGSNPARLSALDTAAKNNTVIATGSVSLVQEKNMEHGVILFAPLYKKNTSLNTESERMHNVIAFLSGVYQPKTIMHSILLSGRNANARTLFLEHDITVQLIDNSATQKNSVLYESNLPPHITDQKVARLIDALSWDTVYHIGEREWMLRVSPTPKYLSVLLSNRIFIILVPALVLIGILNLLLLLFGADNDISEKTLEEIRQAQLTRSQLEYILNTLNTPIIAIDSAGIIIALNEAMEQALAFQKAELLGKDFHEMVHYADSNGQVYLKAQCTLDAVAFQEDVIENGTEVLYRKNGDKISVHYNKKPIYGDKGVIGAVIYFLNTAQLTQP